MSKKDETVVNAVAQDLLKKRGLNYEIDYNVSAADITRPSEGTQVRYPAHIAPKANVRSYSESMKAGAKFPAIIVDRDGMLLDGNTRVAAAERSGTVLNVIRLTDELSLAETKLLQAALNNTNGERLTRDETRTVVRDIVHSGVVLDIAAVARATAYPKATIARWKSAEEFVTRAHRVSVNTDDMAEGTRIALNKLVSDEYIPSAAALAHDANLTGAALTGMVKAVNEAAGISNAAAYEKLDALRDGDYAVAIREAASGLRRPTAMAKHQMHLSYIASKVEVNDIREVAVASVPDVIDTLDAVITKLERMREIARERISTPEVRAS